MFLLKHFHSRKGTVRQSLKLKKSPGTNRKKWSAIILSERLAQLEEEKRGLNDDLTIYNKQLAVKIHCEKYKEAQEIREKNKTSMKQKAANQIEILQLQKKEKKSSRDKRYNVRKRELKNDCGRQPIHEFGPDIVQVAVHVEKAVVGTEGNNIPGKHG